MLKAIGWTKRRFFIIDPGHGIANVLNWRLIVAFRFTCYDQLPLPLTLEPIKLVLFITNLAFLYFGLDLPRGFDIVLLRTLLLVAI